MNAIEIDKESKSDTGNSSVSRANSRESDGKYDKYGQSSEYEAYRTKNSSEYTPYNENGQENEGVYDRYDTEYAAEQCGQDPKPTLCSSKESCCKKGWLSNSENRDSYL